MNGTNESNGNGNRLAALQKRIDTAREKMALKQERVRKREAKEEERLFRTVGEICCKAAQRPGFGAALTAVLEAETDQRTRAFLRQMGMFNSAADSAELGNRERED